MSAWAVLGALLVLAGSFLLNILATEAYSWFPRFANRLVRYHASRLPEPLQERMREEWEALLHDTPGNLAKLLLAIDLFRATPSLTHGFYFPGVPRRPVFEILTREFDLAMAAAGLMLGLPTMLAIAALIKVVSRGPVFARSPRLGRHKREFILYQFRTLEACEAEKCGTEHPYHVTGIGDFLRISRLHEMPQLLNILLGHMSFVGPAPIRPEVAASLSSIPPAVFSVRPGLTGRAQVSGAPSGTAKDRWEYRLALDLQYIMRRGLRENLSILLASLRLSLFSRLSGGR